MVSSLALSYNIRSFVIELDYGYRYLLEVYSELSGICFLSWLRYHSMLALYDCHGCIVSFQASFESNQKLSSLSRL